MEELRVKLQSRMDRHASVIDVMVAEEMEHFTKYGEIMNRRPEYMERMGRIYELDQIAQMQGIELTRRY